MSRIVLFVLLFAGVFVPLMAQESETAYEVRPLEIDLGADFITDAELTLPTQGNAPFPTVILLHGSGPYDMNASYPAADGSIAAHNFLLLAESLAEQGIAVLRFNKRGVNAYDDYDFAQVQASTLDRLVADADAVIAAALEQPEVDADQLYVYGWSEGGVVAANVALANPEVDGLILQGTPNGNVGSVLPYQHLELGLPYLSDVVDTNADGQLSLDEIAALPPSAVGMMGQFYLYDQTSTLANPVINAFTDTNDDGVIAIEDELRPVIEQVIANYNAFLPPTEASWEVGALLAAVEVPVLVLHGESDGWVPVSVAQALADAAEQAELVTFEGLGHALSPTGNPAEDVFGVMDQAAVDAIAAWVNAH